MKKNIRYDTGKYIQETVKKIFENNLYMSKYSFTKRKCIRQHQDTIIKKN